MYLIEANHGQALTEYVLVLFVTTVAFLGLYELLFGLGDGPSVVVSFLERWMNVLSFIISMP